VTSLGESTVIVRCETSEAGAEVGAQVVLAMATVAGIPPLAADRLRGDVRDAVHEAQGAVELGVTVGADGLILTISPPAHRLDAVLATLEGHGAELDGHVVRVRARRTPLQSV
jgi:hypothetical protein